MREGNPAPGTAARGSLDGVSSIDVSALTANMGSGDEPEAPEHGGAPDAPDAGPAPIGGGPSAARSRWIRLAVFAAVFAVAAIFVLPAVPRAQHVRVHLGSGSTRVTSATARIGHGGTWDRETSWRFDTGAPPSFEWDFELPNGTADVEIDLSTKDGAVSRKLQLDLRGGDATLELGEAMRGLP